MPKKRLRNGWDLHVLWEEHAQAQHDPATLRISIDTKAKVKIGAFSRGGRTRGPEPVQAADHDMHADAVHTTAGILEIEANQLSGFLVTRGIPVTSWRTVWSSGGPIVIRVIRCSSVADRFG